MTVNTTGVLSIVALALAAGVASADHHHGGWGGGGRGSWGGRRGGWNPGVAVRYQAPRMVLAPRVYTPGGVYVPSLRFVRRPIYVAAPRIRVHYYNYDAPPALLPENYAPMTGYYWVAGQWSWSGYEWTWSAGHYEPDLSYEPPPSYSNPSCDCGYEDDD